MTSATKSTHQITESIHGVRDSNTDENILIFDGNKLIGMVERTIENRIVGHGPEYDGVGAWVFMHPKYKKSPAQQSFYKELNDNYRKSITDPNLRKNLSRVAMYVHPYYPMGVEDEQDSARLERLLNLHPETFLGNFSTRAEATNVIIKWYNLRDKKQDHLIANSHNNITESISAKRDSYTEQIVLFDNNKLIGMLEEWGEGSDVGVGAWVFMHPKYKKSPAQQSFYNELDDNWKKLQIAGGDLKPPPLSRIDIYAHPYEEDQKLYDLHPETFLGNFLTRAEATNVIIKWYNLRDKQQDSLYVSEDISKTPKKNIANSYDNITESISAKRDSITESKENSQSDTPSNFRIERYHEDKDRVAYYVYKKNVRIGKIEHFKGTNFYFSNAYLSNAYLIGSKTFDNLTDAIKMIMDPTNKKWKEISRNQVQKLRRVGLITEKPKIDESDDIKGYHIDAEDNYKINVYYDKLLIGIVEKKQSERSLNYDGWIVKYGEIYTLIYGKTITGLIQRIIKEHQDSIKPKIDESDSSTGYRIVRKGTTQFYNVLYNGKIIGVVDNEYDDTGHKPYYGSIQYLPTYSSVWGNSITEVIKQIIQSHRRASILPISDLFNLKESNDSEHDKTGYHIVKSKSLPNNRFHVYYGKDKIGYVNFNDIVNFYSGTVMYLNKHINHGEFKNKKEAVKFIIDQFEFYKRMVGKRETPINESEESKYSVVKKLMGASANPVTFVKYYGKIIGSIAKDSENSYAYYPVPFLDMLSGSAKSEVEAISNLIKLHEKLLDNPKTKIDKLDETKYTTEPIKNYKNDPSTDMIALLKDGEHIGVVFYNSKQNHYEVYLLTPNPKHIAKVNSRNEGFQLIIKARNEYEKSQNITENTDNPKTKIDKLDESKYIAKPVKYTMLPHSANNTEKIVLFKDSEYIGMIIFDPERDMYEVFLSTKRIGTVNSRNEGFQLIIKARNEYEKSQNITENTDNPKFTISKDLTYSYRNEQLYYKVLCNGTRIGTVVYQNGDSFYEAHYFGPGMKSINTALKSIKNAIQFIIDKYRQNTEKKLDENKKNIKFTVVNASYKDSNQLGLYIVRANEHDIGDIRLFIEERDTYYGRGHWAATFYDEHRHRHMNAEKLSDAVHFIISEYKFHKKLAGDQKVSESQKRMGPKITVSSRLISLNNGVAVEKIFNIYYNGIKIGEITKSYYGENSFTFTSTYINPELVKYKNQKKSTSSLLLITRPSDGNMDTFQFHLEKLIDKAKEIGRIPKESSDEITEDTKGYNVKKFEYNSTGILHGDGKNYWYDKEIVYKVMFGEELIGYVTTVYELNTLLTLDGNPYRYNNLSPSEKPVNVGRTDNLNKAIQEVINYHKNKGRKKANKLKESALYTKQIKTSVEWKEIDYREMKKLQTILFHIGKTLIGSVVSYYNENNIIVPYVPGGIHFYIATAIGKWLPDSRKGGLLCKTLKEATDYVIDTYLKYKIGIEHE